MTRYAISAVSVLLCLTAGLGWAVEADPISDGSWTMILLPDTQHYVDDPARAPIFDAQTQWIADHQTSHNIQMVLHQGDLTNNNIASQYTYAKHSMDILSTAGVPYSIAPGNHDYGTNGSTDTRNTLFNSTLYFGSGTNYANQSNITFYESGKTDNSYSTFSAGGEDWLVFSAEFGPRTEVLQWMDGVADAHPNHNLIFNTHAHLFNDGSRYDWSTYGAAQTWNPHNYPIGATTNDGQEVWDQLIKKHENWKLVFNGHVLNSGTGWLASRGDNGNIVHQFLANYQMRAQGGEGYLRIMEFKDDGNSVKVSSYSPYLGSYLTGYDQDFDFNMSQLPPPLISGVTALALDVPITTANASSIWTIEGSGPNAVSLLSEPNVADVSIAINDVPTHRNKGVMLASVRQNEREGYYGTVEVSHLNF
ncbi:MAG: metallophosphoesterase, partial [Pirellulales bacterium]|nr:metallophosphoesterase [Pirellulales bacterium]